MQVPSRIVLQPAVERLFRHLLLEQIEDGQEVEHRAAATAAALELLGQEASDELVSKVLSHGLNVAFAVYLLNQLALGNAVATVNPQGDLDISAKA